MTKIALIGATGRVGVRIVEMAKMAGDVEIVAAVNRSQPEISPTQAIDVVVDFSSPAATLQVLPMCINRRIPILVATTGFTASERAIVEEAAHETAVLIAANTSLVVNVLVDLVRRAGQLLGNKGFDLEIIERHHRLKKDAPSGTALQLAATLQEAIGPKSLRHGREGNTGERPANEIGMHSLRLADNVGEHMVVFAGAGEMLELTQRATNRDAYAAGAITAAKWLVGKPAGSYSMADVLGLATGK